MRKHFNKITVSAALVICLVTLTASSASAATVEELQAKLGSTDFSGMQDKLDSMNSSGTQTTSAPAPKTAPKAAASAPTSDSFGGSDIKALQDKLATMDGPATDIGSKVDSARGSMEGMLEGYANSDTSTKADSLTSPEAKASIADTMKDMANSGIQTCRGEVLSNILGKASSGNCVDTECDAYTKALQDQISGMLNPQASNLLGSTNESIFTQADWNSLTKKQQASFLAQNPQFKADMEAYSKAQAVAAAQAATC